MKSSSSSSSPQMSETPNSQTSLSPILMLSMMVTVLLLVRRRRSTDDLIRRLPPGSMGWPYMGETLKLYTENPNTFFSNRRKSHGDIFKSHILGCPCVMISSPEGVKNVLVNQAHLFKPTYPISKEKLIGPQALFFHQGPYHFRLKKLVQSALFPSKMTRDSVVSNIEDVVLSLLQTWGKEDAAAAINTLQEMKKYAFDVAMILNLGDKGLELEAQEIKHLYQCLEKGYNSMPLNLPGTPFRKAVKARKLLNEKLEKLIEKRRENRKENGGLLGILLNDSSEDGNGLDDSQIADNIIGVLFAAHDTTASILTWILKYLHDDTPLLEAVIREQKNIRTIRIKEANRGLRWEDTRNMPLTTRVIQETLRHASILSFTFREAVQDIEFEGYLIPKGWKVLPLFRSIHHCESFFPNPEKFDPTRFEVPPRPNTYMPFGKGAHSCPGSEVAKLEMLLLIHHLTITYRWEVIGEDDGGVQYGPFPVPKQGLPIRLHPR